MGSIGSTVSTSTSVVGKDTTSLDRYTNFTDGAKNLRKDFNLDFATASQIDAIRSVFKGMQEYDRNYDEAKTPYKITSLSIKRVLESTEEDRARMKELGMREDKTIQISIDTEPVTESSYIRMADAKHRMALIGAKGGYYTYNRNSKRTPISSFDIRYGKRSYDI